MTKRISFFFSGFAGIFLVLYFGALSFQAVPHFFRDKWKLLTVAQWSFREGNYGGLSMFYGTAVVAIVALLIAFPIGLGSAIFVSEFLKGKARAFAKVSIELLAGVPSVVYGLLGVLYLREWIFPWLEPFGATSGDSLLTAGVLLSVMVLPTLMTLSDDALRCIPRRQREAAWGLGLSRRQTILGAVLPQARVGILGAAILAFGRAVGETIAVFLVVGRSDKPVENPFSISEWVSVGQTITSKLGGSESAIAYGDLKHWSALMALAATLWAVIGGLTILSQRFLLKGSRRSM